MQHHGVMSSTNLFFLSAALAALNDGFAVSWAGSVYVARVVYGGHYMWDATGEIIDNSGRQHRCRVRLLPRGFAYCIAGREIHHRRRFHPTAPHIAATFLQSVCFLFHFIMWSAS